MMSDFFDDIGDALKGAAPTLATILVGATGVGSPLAPLAGAVVRSLSDSLFGPSDPTKPAATVSEMASAVAAAVASPTPEQSAAIQKVENDFRIQQDALRIKMFAEETARLQVVSDTYKTELASGDKYVRWMRPTWGYAMCASWTFIFTSISYTILFDPLQVPYIVSAVAGLTPLFGFGLGVLGIHVAGRTLEKNSDGPSILPVLSKGLSAITGRK